MGEVEKGMEKSNTRHAASGGVWGGGGGGGWGVSVVSTSLSSANIWLEFSVFFTYITFSAADPMNDMLLTTILHPLVAPLHVKSE